MKDLLFVKKKSKIQLLLSIKTLFFSESMLTIDRTSLEGIIKNFQFVERYWYKVTWVNSSASTPLKTPNRKFFKNHEKLQKLTYSFHQLRI